MSNLTPNLQPTSNLNVGINGQIIQPTPNLQTFNSSSHNIPQQQLNNTSKMNPEELRQHRANYFSSQNN